MKSSCVDGQINDNPTKDSPKLAVNKKIKSQLAIPHSKDDNYKCKEIKIREKPSSGQSGSGNAPYVWVIKGVKIKKELNKMKSNIEDNDKNSQNVLCIDMKKSKFKSSLALPTSMDVTLPSSFVRQQVGRDNLSSKQTSKLFLDNSFTKDSSKQKRHGWVKVKSTCAMQPKNVSSKKKQFMKQSSMMPNIDIEDKEVFNDIMVDLEEIEEVDKHHENYVSFLN